MVSPNPRTGSHQVSIGIIRKAALCRLCRTRHKRHTFCKNLIDAGVGLEQVATLAGHESLETTRRYCTPSRLDLERAVERIGEGE
jgi:site-specific recombinase XerD